MTDIVERLRALAERQKQERGDAMYLGKPDPEITEAANEIQTLREAWRIQHAEKVDERAEAKLWFEKAQEWKSEIERLRKHADAVAAHLEWAHEGIERGDLDERMCCDGRMCGCMGALKGDEVLHYGREALAAYRAEYPEEK